MRKITLCPLCCGSKRKNFFVFPYTTLWDNQRWNYVQCSECQTSYEVPKALKNAKPKGRVLDFGCGHGQFIKSFIEDDYEAFGVEHDKKVRQIAAKETGCIVSDFNWLLESGIKFDVIYLGDVLEHIYNPSEMLQSLRLLLKSDGIFYITGPLERNINLVFLLSNFFGYLKYLRFGGRISNSFPPYHLWMTSTSSMRDFFNKTMKFEEVYYSVVDSGWPYINTSGHWSLKLFIKHIVGLISIVGSLLFKDTGNRFFAIYRVLERVVKLIFNAKKGKNMKAVILAGGFGTRISEETDNIPKPILWYIMKMYSAHGITDFVICCGYKGYVIKEYFANYFLHMSDVTFCMKENTMDVHYKRAEPWTIALVDTGEGTMTGGWIS